MATGHVVTRVARVTGKASGATSDGPTTPDTLSVLTAPVVALGIAIFSTAAVSSADDVLSGVGHEAELRAITEGVQTAFAVAVGVAALGALLAVLLFRARRPVEDPTVGAESRRESIGFEQAHDYAAGKRPGAP